MIDLSKYPSQWLDISSLDTTNTEFRYRKDISPQSIAGLRASLKENGQDIPIVVRRMAEGRLQIVCGFRRCTAAQSLGWDKLKAVIVPETDLTDTDAIALSARENIERKSYTTLDMMFLCKKLSEQGTSNIEIGKLIGKSEAQVRNYLRVADAPKDVQDKLVAGETTIKAIGKNELAPGCEHIVDNRNNYVKSTKKAFEEKLKIPIDPANTPVLEAHLQEVKKAWKEALKARSARAKGDAAKPGRQYQIDQARKEFNELIARGAELGLPGSQEASLQAAQPLPLEKEGRDGFDTKNVIPRSVSAGDPAGQPLPLEKEGRDGFDTKGVILRGSSPGDPAVTPLPLEKEGGDGSDTKGVILRESSPGDPPQGNTLDTPVKPGYDKQNQPAKDWQPAGSGDMSAIPQDVLDALPPEMREAAQAMQEMLKNLPPELRDQLKKEEKEK